MTIDKIQIKLQKFKDKKNSKMQKNKCKFKNSKMARKF